MIREISVRACVLRVLLIAALLLGLGGGHAAQVAPPIPPQRSKRSGSTWIVHEGPHGRS